MAKLEVYDKGHALELMENIYSSLEDRLSVSASTTCPVEFCSSLVKLAAAESCGKCTPCRIGLVQMAELIDRILDGFGFEEDLTLLTELAESIYYSADCAIGFETAALVLKCVKGFSDDFLYHIEHNDCSADAFPAVPCRNACPASVDVPGYLALVGVGRNTDAMQLVRKDNPFSLACGYICEHPCELHCRRGMMDDPLNIRAIKRFADDYSDAVKPPKPAPATGKRIAIIGGGPSGMTTAYFLTCMGHSATVFEQRKQLGGMLRYGIPAYRLPRAKLDTEINYMVSAGIEVHTNVRVGTDITFEQLRADYDAVYVAIGAHADNKLGIDGQDSEGVVSAVELLRGIGDDIMPDYTGKTVVVVGGGNVAMDCARSALRLGAKNVSVAYRRRKQDMTALITEIDATMAEGCELLELTSPVKVESKDGKVIGLTVKQQMIGLIEDGRAKPRPTKQEPYTIPCDLILVAVGQVIDSEYFGDVDFQLDHKQIVANTEAEVVGLEGVYAGGDCVTGPASAIRAIAAGKVAAANIDDYLGFDHRISVDFKVPFALPKGKPYCARANIVEKFPTDLAGDFSLVEQGLNKEEAMQESMRCLRCDHFGYGAFSGGRALPW